jgi:hypothetical protein
MDLLPGWPSVNLYFDWNTTCTRHVRKWGKVEAEVFRLASSPFVPVAIGFFGLEVPASSSGVVRPCLVFRRTVARSTGRWAYGGGPLVDIDGSVNWVINTLMLSEGGGSEGLGFSIPAALVNSKRATT